MVFRSKIDKWFYVVIIGTDILVVGVILSVIKSQALSSLLIIGFVLLVSVGLPLWLLAGTYYLVDDDFLRIRSGPFKWSIRLDEIRSAEPSRLGGKLLRGCY